ncbi:hypothetical protein LJC45_04345 [Alistipes sp. OttesenSCG-928-B03]|nr:hypothetical protein [Alistipes sp. OttesenSCG-928-B03]
MKKLLLLTIFCSVTYTASALSEGTDVLLIGNDTIHICTLPLEQFLDANPECFISLARKNGNYSMRTTNLHGYIAYWRLQDDKLYLEKIDGFGYYDSDPNEKNIMAKLTEHDFASSAPEPALPPKITSERLMLRMFPNSMESGKVYADWFNGDIVIPKGARLRSDGFSDYTSYEEDVMTFKKGQIAHKEHVINYIPVKDGISRHTRETVTDAIFSRLKELNWDKLCDDLCDDEYIITIDPNGKIKSMKMSYYTNGEKEDRGDRACARKLYRHLKSLRFDIIRWHGKPFEEDYTIDIFYNETTGELKNRTR